MQGSVNVSFFKNLKILELKRMPIHLFVGLQYLRTRIQMITCMRCVQCLEVRINFVHGDFIIVGQYYILLFFKDLFVSCGGDRSAAFSWTELLCANLSFNSIEYLGTSLVSPT